MSVNNINMLHSLMPYLPNVRVAVLCVDALVVYHILEHIIYSTTITPIITIRYCVCV